MPASPGARAAEIMAKCASNVKGADHKAVPDAALEAKKAILAELDKVVSGRRLRNVGKGAKLSVAYKVSTSDGGGQALVFARGPWPIIESDIGKHAIRPRKKKGRRAVHFGTSAFYSRVSHPGTKGKHPFEKGHKAAVPKVIKVLDQRYRKAVANAF